MRDSSPKLFSEPGKCVDMLADSGGSREHAESGNNATNAKEEDALVIRM